jgi:hypothetical protein
VFQIYWRFQEESHICPVIAIIAQNSIFIPKTEENNYNVCLKEDNSGTLSSSKTRGEQARVGEQICS